VRIEAKAWHPEDEDMSRALKIIEDPQNQPVFVHCQHGSDRTGTLVAAYRIVEQGWTREDAASELPNFGYHPIWSEVLTYLKRFDRSAMRAKIDATAMPKLDLVE
jgi:protein tyrosine/serine phosphatase